MRATRWIPVLLLAALAGCSGELVGGGHRDVEMAATGGRSENGAVSAMRPAYAAAGEAPVGFQGGGVTGTVSLDARVSLVREAAPVRVGTGSATVRAEGGDTARVVSGGVPRGRYGAARVVFTRVEANVTGGLVVGGVELTGRVDVGIAPGDSVVVEMPVQVTGTDGRIRLLVELDAAAWLAAADPLTRTVPPSAFRERIRVRTR